MLKRRRILIKIRCKFLQFGPDMGPVGPGPGMHGGPLGPEAINPAMMNGNGKPVFLA